MSRSRYEFWLATTVLAMVVTGSGRPVLAAPENDVEISVGAFTPDAGDVPAALPAGPAAAVPAAVAPVPAASAPAAAAPSATLPPAALPPAALVAPATVPANNTKTALPAVTPDGGTGVAVAAPAAPRVAPAAPVFTPASVTPAAIPPAAPAVAVPAPAAPRSPAAAPYAAPAPAAATPGTPAASAPLAPLDQQVADRIRELLATKADRFFDHLQDRKSKTSVETFYASRNYAAMWLDNGRENARGKAAANYLAGVDADGLDPADYPAPDFQNSDPAAMAEAELKFTASVLTYARNAQIGRVHYSRVSSDIVYDLVAPEPAAVLGKIQDARNVSEALDSFNPPHAGYKALKAKLAEARGRTGDSQNRMAPGVALKVGMDDPRVPMLRDRLGVQDGDGTTYDKALAEAVKKFQRQHGLPTTGILNNATVDAFNGPRREHDIDIILANMERWRWMPRDLGKAYVMVNIPEYMLRVFNHGALAWSTRVVTGKPGEKATPLLSETMKYITVNPTWNVPPSIINKEYLPALAQDPTVLERMGLKVEHNRDGSVHISQPPGAGNALGRIRFNFPNKFLVYQHDTPDKYLFALDKRAYSHGCMRVQYPDKYAEVILQITNPSEGYTAERIRKMYGSGERDIQLQTQLPVHLTYQTAFVDDSGKLQIREDIYGRDSKLIAALKSDDRRMAEAPAEGRREANNSPRRQAANRMPPQPSGLGFFQRLFR